MARVVFDMAALASCASITPQPKAAGLFARISRDMSRTVDEGIYLDSETRFQREHGTGLVLAVETSLKICVQAGELWPSTITIEWQVGKAGGTATADSIVLHPCVTEGMLLEARPVQQNEQPLQAPTECVHGVSQLRCTPPLRRSVEIVKLKSKGMISVAAEGWELSDPAFGLQAVRADRFGIARLTVTAQHWDQSEQHCEVKIALPKGIASIKVFNPQGLNNSTRVRKGAIYWKTAFVRGDDQQGRGLSGGVLQRIKDNLSGVPLLAGRSAHLYVQFQCEQGVPSASLQWLEAVAKYDLCASGGPLETRVLKCHGQVHPSIGKLTKWVKSTFHDAGVVTCPWAYADEDLEAEIHALTSSCLAYSL